MEKIEKVKQMILTRKDKIEARAKTAQSRSNDIILGKHEQGVYDEIMGYLGEMEFLNNLLEEIDE